MAKMEEVDQVLAKHFPQGLDGAEPEHFQQAEEELARLFKGRVKVHGHCTWVSTRRPRFQCEIEVDFEGETT